MNIILLSGGSGKRLWPLSNEIRSKQFIKIFKNGNGECESMLQRIYGQIKAVDPEASVTIATSKAQASAIYNQLGENVNVCFEPCKKDTFAAIALATSYLHDIKGVSGDDAVVVCPVDPYAEAAYFSCVGRMYEKAAAGNKDLVLMGIEPTYPSEKYGYIKPVSNAPDNTTWSFKEKPTVEMAEKYIEEGALWNGGVFAFKLSYVLGESRDLLGTSSYADLLSTYSDLDKISFDYAVVESEESIDVIKYSGEWKDLGTWNTLTEAMDVHVIGNGVLNEECQNTHIINELDIPILGMGLKDMVISASPDGILVSDKAQSSYIKPFVDSFDQPVMFAEKSWGSYRVIDIGDQSLTIKVTLNPGHKMNYHSHDRRDEVWTVISGKGRTVVDGEVKNIKPGDVITLAAGTKHTVIADDESLQLIEVQLGKDISANDKHKYEL